jgi:hypothetical protein
VPSAHLSTRTTRTCFGHIGQPLTSHSLSLQSLAFHKQWREALALEACARSSFDDLHLNRFSFQSLNKRPPRHNHRALNLSAVHCGLLPQLSQATIP